MHTKYLIQLRSK